MAKTSTLGITVTVLGDGVSETLGAAPTPLQITNAACPGALPSNFSLAAGFNSIAVPAGAVAMLLIPPVTSVNGKTLKGITGDTGVPLNPALPSVVSFIAGATTIGITSVGIEVVQIGWL